MSTTINSVNYDQPIPDIKKPFQIVCKPDTDLWDKPPSTHSFSAPIIYQETIVSSLKNARVSISANWENQYDQGGLCLVILPKGGERKWVKAGIEFLDGNVYVSTVAKDSWADWSLWPTAENTREATVELNVNEDGALWVYLIAEDGTKRPCREITWWAALPKDTECWIGVIAARNKTANEPLAVDFKDLVIDA